MSLVLALLFALLVAVFAVQNATPVPVRFLTWTFPEISLVLIILGSAALGALFVGLLGMFRQIGMSVRMWDYQARIKRLEGEKGTLQDKAQRAERQLQELMDKLHEMKEEAESRGAGPGGQVPRG